MNTHKPTRPIRRWKHIIENSPRRRALRELVRQLQAQGIRLDERRIFVSLGLVAPHNLIILPIECAIDNLVHALLAWTKLVPTPGQKKRGLGYVDILD